MKLAVYIVAMVWCGRSALAISIQEGVKEGILEKMLLVEMGTSAIQDAIMNDEENDEEGETDEENDEEGETFEDEGEMNLLMGRRRRRRGLGGRRRRGLGGRRRRGLGAITKAANTVASGTVNAANTVASGTVDAANTVASGTVDAANTVASGTVDAANAIADVATDAGQWIKGAAITVGQGVLDAVNAVKTVTVAAFKAILAAVDCLRSGPADCIIGLMPSSFDRLIHDMKGAITNIKTDFHSILTSMATMASNTFEGIYCAKKFSIPYPKISWPSPFTPSIKMAKKEICLQPGYDTSKLKDAANELKDVVLNSTLVSTLLNIGGGSSLLEVTETVEGRTRTHTRMATGHELMGTPCNGFKGSFELTLSAEMDPGIMFALLLVPAGGAIGVGISVGCKDDVITGSVRFIASGGIATPSPDAPPVSAAVSLGWAVEYPAAVDDTSYWSAGAASAAVGVETSGISDWIDLKPFEFEGVFVDFDVTEQFAQLFAAPGAVAPAAGLLEEEHQTSEHRAAAAFNAAALQNATKAAGGVGFGMDVSIEIVSFTEGSTHGRR